MTIDSLAAPLQAALAAKGYSQLTPVQESVLEPSLAGRDLLVSAQTGSGKTVAFGLAMSPEVLGGIDSFLPADKPLALVIAPTRELALQVQAELVWLYEGATVASCVGGMDYRTERRALDRGAHIVVGTPGRLRDHVERKSLDLSELRVVVLDEADEMLDMGFAEDLEFLLGAAPEDKRVLMFSATVPKEIARLAETYQRDARRVEVKSAASQHADIEYKAISVSNRDKEPAIFNLIRWYDAKVAIVFAKTRANVNHLHARMVNRGFPVVALSGELSQSERLHALQALRDGRARVCIATDVAARGIDLPGLDLVIHADLPTNPETLLHRSGRTGRAGRKGTSVLVVPQAEFRKANRILQGAKLVAEWGKAPGADEVQAREDERLVSDPALTADVGEEAGIAAELLEAHGPESIAAAFVRLWRAKRSAPEELVEDLPTPAPLPPRERGEFGPSVWYKLSVGHEGRAEARWLLPKICEAGGIAKDGIGAIRVQQDVTYVQIAEPLAGRFREMTEIEPGLTMERVAEAPEFGPKGRVTSDRPARAPREGKPAWGAKPRFGDDEGDAPRKPRAPREAAEGASARKPWAKREDGDAPKKPWAKREEGDAPKKPWAKREDGDAPKKPWAKRDDGDAPKKPYARRDEGDGAKPRWTPTEGERPMRDDRPAKSAPRSAGYRSHGGSPDRPARSTGFKSHAAGSKPREGYGARDDAPRKPRGEGGAEGRPFVKRDYAKADGGKPAARSAGAKSHGAKPEGKPFAARKPAAKPVDARDTSKRFVPPKRPRG
ncbi:DEAD/DEAH box helicase [Xinfangfangia sp. D13-10-4-6]|uniref:DEAD/DEAH box helicase n=1 Tax=Pseudogemmobacter hezensis TaxID=2737662 RepID=UPI0015556D64|nr:DEAD/DEAH box helicase [Pseudogemmobacter hezensis]NPD16609.1 DEAD/DEAH box helicase [Pseudogemmobacter hezensis]